MLCRALLTIVAVSYLICVLILSGLQKEDLDVNTLKKLQRHGLGIDDINNESRRADCLNSTNKDEIINNEPQLTIATTDDTPEIETKTIVEDSNKTNIKSIIKYFIDSQKTDKNQETKDFGDKTKNIIYESYHIPQTSNMKYLFSDTIGYNSPQLKKELFLAPTTEETFHLFSQNILRLWNTYNKQDVKEFTITTEPATLPTTNSNRIEIKNTSDESKVQYINKLISEFISKHQMTSTTTTLPTTTKLDIAMISDIIRRFLTNAENAPQIFLPQNNSNKLKENDTIKQTTEKGDYFLNKLVINVKNLTQDQADNKKSNIAIKKPPTDSYHLLKEDRTVDMVNNFYASMQKGTNHKSESAKQLPNDLVKELAETVKSIVLRDLKNEISTAISETTSPTTTEKTMTVPEDKPRENTDVMEKIMELFQQIKSIREKTVIAGNSTVKVTEKKDIQHEYKGPVKILYTYKPAISPYGVRSTAEQIPPVYIKQYHEPIIPNYIAPRNLQNPVYQVHQIDNINAKDDLRHSPITIQTNSFEVPPLNIPILKPLGMVNQNIVVTTKSPNIRPRLDTHHTNYNNDIDRYKVADDFNSRNYRHKPSPSPERHKPYARHNVYKPKKSNHNNRDYKRDYYKPHFTKSDYDHIRLRNQEIKRFHERLEKIDDTRSTEEQGDCCKLKVASRQQLPLSHAKQRSRYDDIHFRDFLQTQQKVNDMLEKILATRTRAEGPRSVETT